MMTEFKKGDRLKITIEATATEDSSYSTNVYIKAGDAGAARGVAVNSILAGGGSVSVEVLPKPVVLPMKKYAQVLVCENGKERLATLMTLDEVRPPSPWRVETEHFEAEHWTTELVGKHYVRTISEGVDE